MAALYNAWRWCVLALLTVVVTPAGAVIIINDGVDIASTSYRIDATVSTVTYKPGLVFRVDESGHLITEPPQTYRIAGQFDANFFRYWWTYLTPLADGTVAGPFTLEEHWLRFNNVHLDGLDTVTGFVFPDYWVDINGTDLFGGSACNNPFPPDTYCTGNDLAGGPRLSGQLEEGRLILNGWSSLNVSLLQGFEYHIYASPLPIPGTLLLVISGLAGLSLVLTSRPMRVF